MKTLVLIMMSLFAAHINAQSSYSGTPLYYSEVIQAENTNKNILYSRSKDFINSLYNNPKEVIQVDDSISGVITVKGVESYDEGDHEYFISYLFSIASKDGRYKYEIKDIIFKGKRWSSFYSEWVDTYNDVLTDANLSEAYYNEQIGKKKKKVKDDPTYSKYRDKADLFFKAMSLKLKDDMSQKSSILEEDW